jgi:hypothetical protein
VKKKMKKRTAIMVALMVLSILAVSVSTATAEERDWRCVRALGFKKILITVTQTAAEHLTAHGWTCDDPGGP